MTERYELDCTECSFRTTVTGEFTDVLDEIDAHREEQQAGPTEHFVNVNRRSSNTDFSVAE